MTFNFFLLFSFLLFVSYSHSFIEKIYDSCVRLCFLGCVWLTCYSRVRSIGHTLNYLSVVLCFPSLLVSGSGSRPQREGLRSLAHFATKNIKKFIARALRSRKKFWTWLVSKSISFVEFTNKDVVLEGDGSHCFGTFHTRLAVKTANNTKIATDLSIMMYRYIVFLSSYCGFLSWCFHMRTYLLKAQHFFRFTGAKYTKLYIFLYFIKRLRRMEILMEQDLLPATFHRHHHPSLVEFLHPLLCRWMAFLVDQLQCSPGWN